MSKTKLLVCFATLLAITLSPSPASATSAADAYLKNVQKGDLNLRGVGRMSFGPNGLLLVTEPGSASVVAIDAIESFPVRIPTS